MDRPDESQWDETTCNLAVCQHPQCWAAVRRIERGHPRILGSPCKTPLDTEDKLPVLTIVNISDSCFQAKRLDYQRLSEFTYTKAHSLLSQGSKFHTKFQGRPRKCLPDKSLINSAERSPKLAVLNLNDTELPCPEDVTNMVVIWIPESEKNVSLAEKIPAFSSQYGIKGRKKLAGENKSYLACSERQHAEMQRSPGVIVPPPSPVHFFEPLDSENEPDWKQVAMLPQDLLEDLLQDEGKSMPCPELKMQLAMMKKNLPLEKNRPDSAISSKMFLTVHRLTLQKPALRYPQHVNKLRYKLQTEGSRKQQQQLRKVKTSKKQEAKKKAKSDPGSQKPLHKHSVATSDGLPSGHRTWSDQESDMKQQLQMEIKGMPLKKDSIRKSKVDALKDYLDFLARMGSPEMSETETIYKDVSAPRKADLEAPAASQRKSRRKLSGYVTETRWNPELKLLRILQATDGDNQENQAFGVQSEETL